MKGSHINWKEAFSNGFSTFLALATAILFYFLLLKLPLITHVFAPLIVGLVIAYLMNPLVNLLRKWCLPLGHKLFRKESRAVTFSKVLAVTGGILVFLAAVSGGLLLIIPNLFKSITGLIDTIRNNSASYWELISRYLGRNESVEKVSQQVFETFNQWLTNDFATKITSAAESVYSGAVGVINFLKNFIVGLMIAIYALYNKDLFKAQAKKCLYAAFEKDTVSVVLRTGEKTNRIFGGFIVGKLIDSLIIGVICFIGLTIFGYHSSSLLVSVIVGITNIIPVFGPFIGAIPSALIVWVSEGRFSACIYFVLFIILLQQVDGNIIGPKILGDSTGLSSFWVIVAIVIFGGFFGIAGMIIGVPCFALLYFVVNTVVRRRLERKGLPVETGAYRTADEVLQTKPKAEEETK